MHFLLVSMNVLYHPVEPTLVRMPKVLGRTDLLCMVSRVFSFSVLRSQKALVWEDEHHGVELHDADRSLKDL